MSASSELPDPVIPEDVAHRVLARAAELDAREGPMVPLSRLREIAGEAGISAAALERALQDVAGPRTPNRLSRAWSRLAGWLGTSPVGPVSTLTVNVVAFAATWVLVSLSARLAYAIGGGWMVANGLTILAIALGLGMAVRARAKLTAILLAILAAAQLAEYPLHLIYGIGVIPGAATKWALMLAGGFGILLSRSLAGLQTSASPPALPTEGAAPDESGDQRSTDHSTLRLISVSP